MADIALVCPAHGVWHDLASHILTPLGIPQVRVFRESESLPAGTHTRIAFGPESWEWRDDDVDTWRFTRDGARFQPQPTDNSGAGLPTARLLTFVKNPVGNNSSGDSAIDAFEQTLFWSKERLLKGSRPIDNNELLEWMVFLYAARIYPETQLELHDSIKQALIRRARDGSSYLGQFFETDAAAGSRQIEKARVGAISALSDDVVRGHGGGLFWSKNALNKKSALKSPVLIVARQLLRNHRDKKTGARAAKFLREYLPLSSNALRLSAVEISARLAKFDDLAGRVDAIFRSEEWRLENSLIPRMNPNSKALCFSPLMVLRLYLKIRVTDPEYVVPAEAGCELQDSAPLAWKLVGTEAVSGVGRKPSLFCAESKRISRSLIDNWLILHTAPGRPGHQYKLKSENYHANIKMLEDAWLSLFAALQAARNLPLVQLLPWPHGKRSAISLRYDVDRPVSTAQIEQIIGIQRDFFGTATASWYYFPGDPDLQQQRQALENSGQEVGLHVESITAEVEGVGVTHHSAATSEYWRGATTIDALENRGADYGEFLASQLPIPRPAWVAMGAGGESGEAAGGRIGNTWLIPTAFPLEGSTSDNTLEYFDRLRPYFSEQLQSGGYAIICSHPDLNQQILRELLDATSLDDVWAAPTVEVVARCRHVLQPGNVTVVRSASDKLSLLSNMAIGRLSIRVFAPGAAQPSLLGADLEPGVAVEFNLRSL